MSAEFVGLELFAALLPLLNPGQNKKVVSSAPVMWFYGESRLRKGLEDTWAPPLHPRLFIIWALLTRGVPPFSTPCTQIGQISF